MTTLGDSLAARSRTDRIVRNLLHLNVWSVLGAPSPKDDLGVWLAAAFERADSLSGGERIVFDVALAVWNGDRDARVADLVRLDAKNRAAVAAILAEWLS